MKAVKFSRAPITGLVSFLVVIAGLVSAGGCTSVRNSLGPRESVCFRILPAAAAAVHDQGTFSGVRLTTAPALLADLRRKPHPIAEVVERSLVEEAAQHPRSALCLAAYKGSFSPSAVELGWSPTGSDGPWALVAVRVPSGVVLATIILRKTPIRVSDEPFSAPPATGGPPPALPGAWSPSPGASAGRPPL